MEFVQNSPKRKDYESDYALAKAAHEGDERARTLVAEELYDRVRIAVYFLAAGHRDWEDWVQLVLLEILKSLGTFRADSSLVTWGNRIALRHTMRLIKQRRWRDQIVMLKPEKIYQSGGWNQEGDRFLLKRRVSQTLLSMKPKYREAIVLRMVYGYSVDEITQMIDAPKNTVRQRLRRGRQILLAKMSKDPTFKSWVRKRDS